jgi:choline dehydrogenase-like flavoprotein
VRPEELECDTLVVGSGPGGSTTACILAEAGRDVLMVEEGGFYRQDSAAPYSIAEIDQKYRNGGLTTSFGKTRVTYIEGRCVGGGSEINAALCHFPMAETLREWRHRYRIRDFGPEEMAPYFAEIERDFTVCRVPHGLDPASLKLKEGADNMGWACEEVPRFWRYDGDSSGRGPRGRRQSMTETLVPRSLAAGCRLLPGTRVRRLQICGRRARWAEALARDQEGRVRPLRLHFRRVVVCGGPTQTPSLLQRSGFRGVGRGFTLHPMIRIVARFPEPANDPSIGVPVMQVVQFKPHITLGCSYAGLPHVAMWLGSGVQDREARLREWRNLAIFYVLVSGSGRGRVVNVPGFDEALVIYPLNDLDLWRLGEGLYLLGKLLFSVGALEIYNPIFGAEPLRRPGDLEPFRGGLPHGRATVSTIHLFASCPMGEEPGLCAVDSYGKVHGLDNVWVNDASILPDGTGVNPQATLMAIARRNARRMLDGEAL